MSKQWPFPLHFDICHGNAHYFEWRNVYIINLWCMDCNEFLFQVSFSVINHWNPFYSFLLHWEKIWCIFPKGRNCDLGVILERVITACINWNMMHMRLWKCTLHIPSLFSEIQVNLGSFVNPFPTITQGELEPQFASKEGLLWTEH